MKSSRQLVRMAAALAGAASMPRDVPAPPAAAWQACLRSAEVLTLAEQRGWQHAGALCRRELAYHFDHLRRWLEVARAELAEPVRRAAAPARDIYDDLAALEVEFPGLRVNLKTREIAVTTEPIILEGVPLGAFEIVLGAASLEDRSPYRVVALQPHHPAGDDTVTHPHVRDEELCEGEAAGPLRRALRERRVLDFFTIVNQTLATYNASSAFVRLAEWGGATCSECGDFCGEEETAGCERCRCDLCDNCGACCNFCEQVHCHNCLGPCHNCEQNVCGGCQRHCETCRKSFCEECINEGLCHGCVQPASDEPALVSPDELARTADAAVHADGVGEAVVLA